MTRLLNSGSDDNEALSRQEDGELKRLRALIDEFAATMRATPDPGQFPSSNFLAGVFHLLVSPIFSRNFTLLQPDPYLGD